MIAELGLCRDCRFCRRMHAVTLDGMPDSSYDWCSVRRHVIDRVQMKCSCFSERARSVFRSVPSLTIIIRCTGNEGSIPSLMNPKRRTHTRTRTHTAVCGVPPSDESLALNTL